MSAPHGAAVIPHVPCNPEGSCWYLHDKENEGDEVTVGSVTCHGDTNTQGT